MLHSAPVDPADVEVVLVRPARAANVAASCRAMKNMGLRTLRLVGPLPEAPDEARALAYGAWDVLDGATVARTLAEAVAGSTIVAGTSGRGTKGALTPREFAAEASVRAGGGRVSVVFGPESSGLTREELELCPLRVHIPSDAAHPSLNLAQAVLIVAYEVRLASAPSGEPPPAPRATVGELESALADLRAALLAIGYLNPESPGPVQAELRALIARADPTPREVVLLRGLARQIAWAGRRIAEGRTRSDNAGAGG
jgi:TrmH family RNA methyltransferase